MFDNLYLFQHKDTIINPNSILLFLSILIYIYIAYEEFGYKSHLKG